MTRSDVHLADEQLIQLALTVGDHETNAKRGP